MSEILWWKVINRRTLAFFTAGEKLVQRGRKRFYEQQNLLFDSSPKDDFSWDKIQNVYSMAALWMTAKDVEADFCVFSNNKEHNIGKAIWYSNIPYIEVAKRANELFDSIFPQADKSAKIKERRQKDLDDFANYGVLFKT